MAILYLLLLLLSAVPSSVASEPWTVKLMMVPRTESGRGDSAGFIGDQAIPYCGNAKGYLGTQRVIK